MVLLIVGLVFLSSFFSATETAFSCMNVTRMKTLAEKHNRRAALALKLSEKYDKLLSTILIGNNIVNIAAATAGTVLFVRLLGDSGTSVSTAVITVVVLIFGEITPKTLAKEKAEGFACFSAPILNFLAIVFTPLCFLFSLWNKLITKLFGVSSDDKMSQDELLTFVDEIQQNGSIDENESELLKNVIEFKEVLAKDILVHRTEIEAVSNESTKQELVEAFARTQFSRLLVYRDDIDHVIGSVHIKDLYDENGIVSKDISELIKPVVFVLFNEQISSIFSKLQKSQSHIAVVLDEFGGTFGMLTIEDILEELVGEIWDEYDDSVELFEQTGENVWNISGLVNMKDFAEKFELEIETERTLLSGWLLEKFGQIPDVGSQIEYQNHVFTVLEIDKRRISRLSLTIPSEEQIEAKNTGE